MFSGFFLLGGSQAARRMRRVTVVYFTSVMVALL